MTLPLLHTIASLLLTCSKHVSRAARKLRPGGPPPRPAAALQFLAPRRKKIAADLAAQKLAEEGEGEEAEDYGEEDVWRRTILMGEKCQPLDFSGVIYYDADGRRLDAAPTPRSPLRSPLPSYLAPPPDPVTAPAHRLL